MFVANNLHFDVPIILAELHEEDGRANHLILDLKEHIGKVVLVVHETNSFAASTLRDEKGAENVSSPRADRKSAKETDRSIHTSLALIMIPFSYPIRRATSSASSTVRHVPFSNVSSGIVPSGVRSATSGPSFSPPKDPLQGTEGSPAVCARILAAILSPRTLMTGDVGPINLIPLALSEAGSSGFSEAWPQPGHTASTPVVDSAK